MFAQSLNVSSAAGVVVRHHQKLIHNDEYVAISFQMKYISCILSSGCISIIRGCFGLDLLIVTANKLVSFLQD